MRIERDLYARAKRIYQLLVAAALMLTPQLTIAAPAKMILAFGDSLTAGYLLQPAESFPAQLQAALTTKGRAVTVHNAGVSGDTTAQGRARLAWVLTGLKTRPDLAIVELGANDMLRGQPPAAARANLDAILAELGKRHIPVILAGMLAAPNLGPAYKRDFEGMYPALAKTHGAVLYPFFMEGVAAVPRMQLGDGLHPTPMGVGVIVKRMLPLVERELDRHP